MKTRNHHTFLRAIKTGLDHFWNGTLSEQKKSSGTQSTSTRFKKFRYIAGHKKIIGVVLLALVVLKIGNISTKSSVIFADDESPNPKIYQVRPGRDDHCHFPYRCLNDKHDIFFRIEFKRGSGDTCYLPDFVVPFPSSSLKVFSVKINNLHLQHFSPGESLKEDCSYEIQLNEPAPFISRTGFPMAGKYEFEVQVQEDYKFRHLSYKRGVHIYRTPIIISSSESCPDDRQCGGTPTIIGKHQWDLCNQLIGESEEWNRCYQCFSSGKMWTAIGCIPTDAEGALQVLIRIGLLLGGGFALMIILAGSFLLSVSQGDPKKTGEAKDMITSALIGLIFIIFSVSILQFIGVEILQIPQFGD